MSVPNLFMKLMTNNETSRPTHIEKMRPTHMTTLGKMPNNESVCVWFHCRRTETNTFGEKRNQTRMTIKMNMTNNEWIKVYVPTFIVGDNETNTNMEM